VVQVSTSDSTKTWSIPFGQQISFDLTIDAQSAVDGIELGVFIRSTLGFEVASWTSRESGAQLKLRPGLNTFRIEFQQLRLLPGTYMFDVGLRDGRGGEEYISEAASFEITASPESAEISAQQLKGLIVPLATISHLT